MTFYKNGPITSYELNTKTGLAKFYSQYSGLKVLEIVLNPNIDYHKQVYEVATALRTAENEACRCLRDNIATVVKEGAF